MIDDGSDGGADTSTTSRKTSSKPTRSNPSRSKRTRTIIQSTAEEDDSDEGEEEEAPDSDGDDSYNPEDDKPKKPRARLSQLDYVQLCREFREREGHLRIPSGYDQPASLASWAAKMRQSYQKLRNALNGQTEEDVSMERIFQRAGINYSTRTLYALEELEGMEFAFDVDGDDVGSGEGSTSQAGRGNAGVARKNIVNIVWEMNLKRCLQFKAKYNHLNILNSDKDLGKWVERMRSLYRERCEGTAELSNTQKEWLRVLESHGFCFDRVFDANLLKLAAYKEQHGHCRVPIQYKPDPKLGHWAENIRRENNRMNRGEKSTYLTKDRLRKLSNIGFVFRVAPPTVPWEQRFELLKKYREENGCDPTSSHAELGEWVGRQRTLYNRALDGMGKGLSDEKMEKLRGIGFVLDTGKSKDYRDKQRNAVKIGKRKSFDDRVQDFVRWKEEHGHPYVPTVTDGEDKQLGLWVAKQRMAYRALQTGKKHHKYGMMTPEKALKLANAGFAFEASHIRRTPKDVAGESPAKPGKERAAQQNDGDSDEESEEDSGEEESNAGAV